jgi:hypothetical protein
VALRAVPNNRIPGSDPSAELNPSEIAWLAAARGVPVALSWRAGHDDGAFDAVLGDGAHEVVFPAALEIPGTALANAPRPRATSEPDLVTVLRTHLESHLPEHMRPAQFVALPQLPLTRNGKLDRDALPDPADQRESPRSEDQKPRTDTEKALAAIWSDLLGRRDVGRDDSFFHLGGDSLVAARMLAATRVRFGTGLALRHVLTAPTLAGFARAVDDDLIADLDETEIARLLDGEGHPA